MPCVEAQIISVALMWSGPSPMVLEQVAHPTLRALIGGAYVESVTAVEPHSGRHRRYTSESSLEGFRQNYFTVTQLASQTRRNPGAEAIMQTDRGIAPLPLPERCQTIYHRAYIG